MNSLNLEEVCQYVNEHIDQFHLRRIEALSELKLGKLIGKNPYLFRAKNINKASELIEGAFTAFESSSEEKQFGDFLEDLAIFIASKTTGGHKSTAPGMDLEFDHKGVYHVVAIKSGKNWGNSSQHEQLKQNFIDAEKRLKQSAHITSIQKVLGICYGKTKSVYTSDGYIKLVGQNFWAYISENQNLYVDIVEPLGYRAKEHNETYLQSRDRVINKLTGKFISEFCSTDGTIEWAKLLKANSGNYDLDGFFKNT